MPEWLTTGTEASGAIAPLSMALRMLVALLGGWAIAWIYRLSHGRDQADTRTLSATLVLLAVLIAMVSMVIGDSVAKAFSLVGALSIVRFRTVVDDTRDTAFVIFAVIVGMAAGANALLVPAIGIPIVGGAAIAMSRLSSAPHAANGRNGRRRSRTLMVKLGLGADPAALLHPTLQSIATEFTLVGTSTARQGTVLEVTYELRLRPDVTDIAIVQTLNVVEGVLGVELRAT